MSVKRTSRKTFFFELLKRYNWGIDEDVRISVFYNIFIYQYQNVFCIQNDI